MRTAIGYLNTSAKDCRISLQHCKPIDLPILREALVMCQATPGNKTKENFLASRIKQLEKES